MVMAVIVFSINQAWVPFYFGLMKSESNPERTVSRVVKFYVVGIGGICLAGILFSPEIIQWIVPQQYKGASIYVAPILFAYLLQGFYYFASASLLYYKKTRLLPLMTLVSAALTVGLNLWWIPIWGALGSAWATLVSFGMLFSMSYILGRRYQQLDLPKAKLSILVGLIFAAVVWNTFRVSFVDSWIVILSVNVAILAVFCFLAIIWIVKPSLHTHLKSREASYQGSS
jgi:O-antigen/teichoic acid export membrane protein